MATAALRVGVVLIAAAVASAAGEGGANGDLTYAKIKLTKTWENGTLDELEQMSGADRQSIVISHTYTMTHVFIFYVHL